MNFYPNVIFNPHALQKRMTIIQMLHYSNIPFDQTPVLNVALPEWPFDEGDGDKGQLVIEEGEGEKGQLIIEEGREEIEGDGEIKEEKDEEEGKHIITETKKSDDQRDIEGQQSVDLHAEFICQSYLSIKKRTKKNLRKISLI